MKGTLDAFATGDLAYREGLIDSGPMTADYKAFEDLDPLFAALNNAGVHVNRITGAESRHFGFHLLALDFINHIHGITWEKNGPQKLAIAAGRNFYSERE